MNVFIRDRYAVIRTNVQRGNIRAILIHEILSFDKVWERMVDEVYRFRLASKLTRWIFRRDKECK